MFAGVGERTREGTQLYREMLESGVMKDTVMVYGQMNEPSGVRLRVALTALAMAEYFRDQGRDVLLFVDNIFRFSMSGSEVSATGADASAVGYQPTLATEMGELQERITSTRTGSITSMQAVTSRQMITPILRRWRHLPTSARPLPWSVPSWKKVFTLRWIRSAPPPDPRSEHRGRGTLPDCAKSSVLQRYKDLQDIIAILGIDELSEDDKLVVACTQDRAFLLSAVLCRRALYGH